MTTLLPAPGFVARTEATKAAFDNGFRVSLDGVGPWLSWRSSSVPATIFIAVTADGGFALAHDHAGAAAEGSLGPRLHLDLPPSAFGPWRIANASDLHTAIERVWRLAASLPDAPLDRFRKMIADTPVPTATEAAAIVRRRIGQDIFRDALMAYWGGCCPLSGISEPELLRASHITPWAEADDATRLDVHNGLLLSALWDAAFDRGLVSFADDGMPLATARLTGEARRALGFDQAPPINGLRAQHRVHLAAHRARWGI